ncbi:MAG: hypothetical protein ACRDQA_24435 [Nocardioidaceae bacterium]
MRVKMKMQMSGSHEGRAWPARGETLTVPDDEGAKLCASGIAEPVAEKGTERAEKAVPSEPSEHRGSKAKRRADS